MSAIATNFDKECGVTPESTAHTTKDDAGDIKHIVDVVRCEKLWEIQKGRKHRSFKTLKSDPLIRLNRIKLENWMKKKVTEYKKYKQLQEGDVLDTEPSDTNSSDIDLSDN